MKILFWMTKVFALTVAIGFIGVATNTEALADNGNNNSYSLTQGLPFLPDLIDHACGLSRKEKAKNCCEAAGGVYCPYLTGDPKDNPEECPDDFVPLPFVGRCYIGDGDSGLNDRDWIPESKISACMADLEDSLEGQCGEPQF